MNPLPHIHGSEVSSLIRSTAVDKDGWEFGQSIAWRQATSGRSLCSQVWTRCRCPFCDGSGQTYLNFLRWWAGQPAGQCPLGTECWLLLQQNGHPTMALTRVDIQDHVSELLTLWLLWLWAHQSMPGMGDIRSCLGYTTGPFCFLGCLCISEGTFRWASTQDKNIITFFLYL